MMVLRVLASGFLRVFDWRSGQLEELSGGGGTIKRLSAFWEIQQ